jgi:hypothetical protein
MRIVAKIGLGTLIASMGSSAVLRADLVVLKKGASVVSRRSTSRSITVASRRLA